MCWIGTFRNLRRSLTSFWLESDVLFQGDSGGPLLLADALDFDISKGLPKYDLIVGITSYGPRGCDSSHPTVYTNVGFFKDWIQDAIDNKDPNLDVLNGSFM